MYIQKIKMKFLVFIIFCLSIIACGSHSDSSFDDDINSSRAQTVMITSDTIYITASGENMSEMKFDKKVIRVPANKAITIALINKSSDATMPHNLVIIKKGSANQVGQGGYKYKENAYVNPTDTNVIAHSPLVQIGETEYFSFITPSIGTYEFICSYPGHWSLMKGEFITEKS